MKKLLVIAFVLFSIIVSAQLPSKFTIEEYAMSIGTDFKVPGTSCYIDEEIVSLTANFTCTIHGAPYAYARQKMFSIGTKIMIYDGKQSLLGSIEEQVFNSWGVYTKYLIKDKNGALIATSEKHQLMSTSMFIKDSQGRVLCKITRPTINMFGDSWDVEVFNSEYDKRLFLFIPCYKTYRDNKEN